VNIEGAFEANALRILRGIPGLTVTVEPGGEDRGVDAIVHFADQRTPVAIEFKRTANAATAWQLVHYAQARPGQRWLLIADRTTTETRAILEEHGIGVVDGLGNAHVQLPGLLFHLEGTRRPERPKTEAPPTRLQGKAGVVAQALLLEPNRDWQVKDLAKTAHVSAPLAHRVLARLDREGVTTVEGAGPNRTRRIADPTALLDLWAEENVEHPRRTLAHLLVQTPRQLITKLGANLRMAGVEHALTGAGAASLLAPFITAVPVVEVWVAATAAADELYAAAHADPVTDGQNVVFLQAKNDDPLAFKTQRDDLWLANRFRIYADLRRDPRRGREQADNLRQEVIGF
jgi:hypothetical protein